MRLPKCAELDESVRVNAERALSLNANIGSPHFALGRLGRREDAKRVVDRVKGKTTGRFIDPIIWVWGHLALGESAQALRLLNQAIENPQYRQEIFVRTFIKQNSWSDPVLEGPEFVVARKRLAF